MTHPRLPIPRFLLSFSLVFFISFFLLLFTLPAAADDCGEADWVARIVSAQGTLERQRAGVGAWETVSLDALCCAGDILRLGPHSRGAVRLRNDAYLRLDANSVLQFTEIKEEKTSFLLDLLEGAVHVFSRMPRRLQIRTPYVNAAVDGTEFLVEVRDRKTTVTVFEGQVSAANDLGRVVLVTGQTAVAGSGERPVLSTPAGGPGTVAWARYYPPVFDVLSLSRDGSRPPEVRSSAAAFAAGDITGAFAAMEGKSDDPAFHTWNASLHMAVGDADAARKEIAAARALSPRSPEADAVESVLRLTAGEGHQALVLAESAAGADSAPGFLALSYARQARFDLTGAREALAAAVEAQPENALAWARLAEMDLSLGDHRRGVEEARKAVALDPDLPQAHTVLGFAELSGMSPGPAAAAFTEAVNRDPAAPLPRLGLGLARIRQGDLKEGRTELEIAASLDPGSAIVRSYLGKAYYEERRDTLAAGQYDMAKQLDPDDPTPWLYDALRKQSENRPVEALRDLTASIERNDNRAVYRSRLLLDNDLAARSAGIGRIYGDLGFDQLALAEGWKSVAADPGSFSAHRLLADHYATLPRHEVARVSELLQSQLLQPLTINPVQPRLAESSRFIVSGTGPEAAGPNEFTPLFERDRAAVQSSTVAGGNSTFGNETVVSVLEGKVAASAGYYRYQTNGFRENNDLDQEIIDAFVQTALTPNTSLQAEVREVDQENGDLSLRFLRENFIDNRRDQDIRRYYRAGLRHEAAPGSDFLFSVMAGSQNLSTEFFPIAIRTEIDELIGEFQHLLRRERFHLITGAGHYDGNQDDQLSLPPFPPFFIPVDILTEVNTRHSNAYAYLTLKPFQTLDLTLGASADAHKGFLEDTDRINPKLGLVWEALPGTTFRAAAFRTLDRLLVNDQTLEPVQVAGFNQFFNDGSAGTEVWRYGVGLEQRFGINLAGGIEVSRRDLDLPFQNVNIQAVETADLREDVGRAYVYWTPRDWMALSAEFLLEDFDHEDFPGEEQFFDLTTRRLPLGARFFCPAGFTLSATGTWVNQEGTFAEITVNDLGIPADVRADRSDTFWVFDAGLSWRLPKRTGILALEVKNLFDHEFNFQDTDPRNPAIFPERLFLAKFTIAF